MIVASVLALTGILLLAAGTPRQAATLFGDRVNRPGRRMLRFGGFALLAASLYLASIDGDRARHLVACIATIGIEAAIVALIFTVRSGSPRS